MSVSVSVLQKSFDFNFYTLNKSENSYFKKLTNLFYIMYLIIYNWSVRAQT